MMNIISKSVKKSLSVFIKKLLYSGKRTALVSKYLPEYNSFLAVLYSFSPAYRRDTTLLVDNYNINP